MVTYNAVEDIRIRTTIAGRKIIEIIINEAPQHKKPVEVLVSDGSKVKRMKTYIRQGSADVEAKAAITAGGLLFFGLPHIILSKFPHFQLDMYDRRSEGRWQHRISSIVDDLNVFGFFEECHSYLQLTAQNKFQLDENRMRLDGLEALRDALREALINFCMHADYFTDKPNAINIYWDYYDFKNSGMMKIPVENFFTTNDSRYRNTIISKLFVNIGFGERGGTGDGIISNLASSCNVRFPEIISDFEGTELRVWTVDYIESVNDLPIEEQLVYKIIVKAKSPIGRKEIVLESGLTRYKVAQAIDNLLENGLIEKVGSSATTKYQQLLSVAQQIANIKQIAANLKFPEK